MQVRGFWFGRRMWTADANAQSKLSIVRNKGQRLSAGFVISGGNLREIA
jgi:hypothetical protein